jgi:transcriptional regulator with XRE-family HTH domain
VNRLLEQLREQFKDEDVRYAYVEGFLNASIAAQIKELRGEMSQQELAEKIGTKQSGVSRIENVNYSAWKVETLRKLARAFGLRLRISFEEFGTLIPEIENFNKKGLSRRRFEDDPVFNGARSGTDLNEITGEQHLADLPIGNQLLRGNAYTMSRLDDSQSLAGWITDSGRKDAKSARAQANVLKQVPA